MRLRLRRETSPLRREWSGWLFLLLSVAVIAAVLHSSGPRGRTDAAALPHPVAPPAEVVPKILPTEFAPLAPEDARAANARIPLVLKGFAPARPFTYPGDTENRGRARDCLAAAMLYEAGDDAKGQQAVGQVVINRVRHPAFPKSICAVVFQGSERATGCQFTFTCDGSLARVPTRQGWEAARRIAVEALSGAVEPSVGMATHYHADYVVPYWASSLAKIAKLDRHIFYRWTGGWGRRAAFTQSVSQEQLLADQPQIDAIGEAGLFANGVMPTANATPKSPLLLADETAGSLGDVNGGLAEPPAISPLAADANRIAPVADATSGRLKGE